MTDKDNNRSNQSDWLNKIKEQGNVSEDDQKQTVLDEEEKEIEVEIKETEVEEKKEEEIEPEGKKEKDSEKKIIDEEKEEIKDQEMLGELLENESEPETEEEKAKEPLDEVVPEHKEQEDVGIVNLPKNMYAHFLLVDIDAPVKEIRGLPRYLLINNSRTLIGRYSKAHIFLDDPASIAIKHAKVIFEEKKGKKDFTIYQINDSNVSVNGISLSGEGIVLKSGDLVGIGSAKLLFFYCELERTD